MTITLRQESDARASTKGTSLNFQELDNNFIDLLNRTELTVEGDSGSAQLSTAATEDRRLVVNGAGGLTTAISSDSTGQAVLTITQGAAAADFAEGVVAGTGISVTSDSTGQVTVSNTGLLNIVEDTTPQLGGTLDGQGSKIEDVEFDNYKETIYSAGSTTGTITPDVANGNVQKITLTGNITFNAFANAETGQSMTLIVIQPASGGPYTLTSTMKFAGGTKTLSTGANEIDVISVFYDGTNYYASLSTNFS